MAFVRDSSQRLDDESGEPGESGEPEVEYSLCLQITDLELSALKTLEDTTSKLYPSAAQAGTDKS